MLSSKKTSLKKKKKMQSIYRSKTHTHTHTQTKQVKPILYFKNKSRQFSEHTLIPISLVMSKSHCTYTCTKSSKEFCVLCVKTLQGCISVSCYNDLRYKKINFTNHNCLMETITFEVHPITLISPRNMLTTICKSILIFLLLIFLCIFFSFEHIMHGHIRERRNTQLC